MAEVTLTQEELMAEIERLTKANAALQKEADKGKNVVGDGLKLKVSDKGAISVYGLGRFPVTLYRGQMERLLDAADDIRAFIELSAEKLAVKSEKAA